MRRTSRRGRKGFGLSAGMCPSSIVTNASLPSFGRMRRLAAELLHEPLRMRLLREAKDLVPFLLPDNRVPVSRKREPVRPAKFTVLLESSRRYTFLLAGRPNTGNFPPRSALGASGDATLAHQPIAFNAQLVDFGEHPCQQLFGRRGADTCPLEIENLFALPGNLAPPSFDVSSNKLQVHVACSSFSIRTKREH
jgi:hypothetical protein